VGGLAALPCERAALWATARVRLLGRPPACTARSVVANSVARSVASSEAKAIAQAQCGASGQGGVLVAAQIHVTENGPSRFNGEQTADSRESNP
jgi:hypothetical protein